MESLKSLGEKQGEPVQVDLLWEPGFFSVFFQGLSISSKLSPTYLMSLKLFIQGEMGSLD